jgi:tetratricopeptide (TPR) repeat protein
VTEELSALAASADDPHEIPISVPLPELNVPSFRCDVPEPEPVVNQSAISLDVLFRRGMALKKERRFKEAIGSFDRVRHDPSYCLKGWAQIGICYTEMGENLAAIEALRTALHDESASRNEVIKVQYSLARALECVGEVEEAASVYQRIMFTNPTFKDTAARLKRLSVPQNALNGKRPVGNRESWFGHVIDSLHQIIGSRR